MLLGFQKQFKQPIMEGPKIHTLREDVHNRWHAGRVIHMATGVRTKQCEIFKVTNCTGIEDVFMSWSYRLEISIGTRYIDSDEKELLAKNDGFANYGDFEEWFYNRIRKTPDRAMLFNIIHWTDFRYCK